MPSFAQVLFVAAALAACLGGARAQDDVLDVIKWNSLAYDVQVRTCDNGCTFNDISVPDKKKVRARAG